MQPTPMWFRRATRAVPYGVIGGAAALVAALAWRRRRTGVPPGTPVQPSESSQPPESSHPESSHPESSTYRAPVDVALTSDEALVGESYDSVDIEDAAAEWLLRATESQPATPDPERRRAALFDEAISDDQESALDDGSFEGVEDDRESQG